METRGAGANPERRRQTAPTLDAFAALTAQSRGLPLSALSPIDAVDVRTRNTTCRITLLGLQDGRMLVQGGNRISLKLPR